MSWNKKLLRRKSMTELRNEFLDSCKTIVIDKPISRDVPFREDGVNEPKHVEEPRSDMSICETTTVSAFFEWFKEESFEQLSDEQKIGILRYVELKEKLR